MKLAIPTGLLGAALLMGMSAGPATAAVMRADNEVRVPAGETIQDDLYVAGGQVTIDGHITGDLVAAGGTVIVHGRVDGDIIAAGGTLRLDGRTGQSVRVAGGDVTLDGPVATDVLAFGGSVKTAPSLVVRGESFISGGELKLDGQLGRELQANGGSLQLDGRVAGPAALQAPTLHVGSGARIEGPLHLTTSTADPVATGAAIGGAITTDPMREVRGSGFGGWVLGFLMALTVGLTLLWLVPETAERSGTTAMREPGWRMLAGLAALVGAPIAAALIMVTIIGIPLGVILIMTFAVSLYLAQLVVAWTAGQAVLSARPIAWTGYKRQAAAFAIGLLIVYLARAIPFLGPLVTFVVLLWGLGTIATMAYQRLRTRRQPAEISPA